jgi:hypothetical protein
VDSRNRDLEAFLLEISEYDEYVRLKLGELGIQKKRNMVAQVSTM